MLDLLFTLIMSIPLALHLLQYLRKFILRLLEYTDFNFSISFLFQFIHIITDFNDLKIFTNVKRKKKILY
jgi:hypothetical protein